MVKQSACLLLAQPGEKIMRADLEIGALMQGGNASRMLAMRA
jgi:hypothetical protein